MQQDKSTEIFTADIRQNRYKYNIPRDVGQLDLIAWFTVREIKDKTWRFCDCNCSLY